MAKHITDVVEVIEIEYYPTVNKYLKAGWILIGRTENRYCLGWSDADNEPLHLNEPLTIIDSFLQNSAKRKTIDI